MTELSADALQQWHRLPSDTLLCHLQYRLRCNRRDGFTIVLVDRYLLAASNERGTGKAGIVKGEL